MQNGHKYNTTPALPAKPLQNPSAWRYRLPAFALAVCGAALSVYLALYQYHVLAAVWDPFFGGGSVVVLNYGILRPISRASGFPLRDALLGAAAYAIEAALAVAGDRQRARTHPWVVVAYAASALCMGLAAVGLVAAQGAIVHAWCTLCLVSAALSAGIVWLSRHEIAAAAAWISERVAGRRKHPQGNALVRE